MRVFTDSRCQKHLVPDGFVECPPRYDGIREHLEARGYAIQEDAVAPLERSFVRELHVESYLERFEQAVAAGSPLLDTTDNPLSAGTWEAAWAGAAATVQAAEWVRAQAGRRAFALVRPPGHHAEADSAMGFCFLNNIALAAQYLVSRAGLERIAIFDFDVHHGNGTQHLFESRADVLFISTHQYPFYPGTGAASETGIGPGKGATLNVPLSAGTGDAAYLDVFHERVLPALDRYRPQLLLLSAGFDAWERDPLGGLRLSRELFGQLGVALRELAERHCDGRVLAVLEGGYDLASLPLLVEAHLAGLGG